VTVPAKTGSFAGTNLEPKRTYPHVSHPARNHQGRCE